MRMGVGYDSHRFGTGNALRLGGITIEGAERQFVVGFSDLGTEESEPR